MALSTLRAMAAGGIHDQVGGGFARYAVDATWTVPHFEKMLYDNALLARAYLHGFQVSGDERAAAHVPRTRSTGCCGDARRRGRLLLRPGRRLRGRRGPLLRVDDRRAARGAGRPGRRGDRLLRSHRARATSRAATSCEARGPVPAARDEIRARLLRGPRAPGAPWARRQAPDVLERPDDRRAGRGGGGARATRTTSTRRSGARSSCSARCATSGGRLLRTWKDGRARLDGYLEDHAFTARGAARPLRGDVRRALVRRGAGAGRRDDRGLRRPRARRVLQHRRRRRGPGRPAQGARGHADPQRIVLRRPRPAAPGRPDRGVLLRGPGRSAPCASSTRSRPGTRRPSGTCSRRWTSTSPRHARWRWSGPTRASWSASCAPRFRPHVVLAGGRRRGGRSPAAGAIARRRPGGRLRVRELRLPDARDRAGAARGAAGLNPV